MSKALDIAFAKTIMDIRGSNPTAWEEFKKLLALRIDEITEAYVKAPPAEIMLHQGRAQEARALFLLLDKSPQTALELQQKEQLDAYHRRQPGNGQL